MKKLTAAPQEKSKFIGLEQRFQNLQNSGYDLYGKYGQLLSFLGIFR